MSTKNGPRRPDRGPDEQTGRGATSLLTIPNASDETDRPRCAVVGVYCEALGWLRREPQPASVCCRHYWAEVA
jgi:hypothetical protein